MRRSILTICAVALAACGGCPDESTPDDAAMSDVATIDDRDVRACPSCVDTDQPDLGQPDVGPDLPQCPAARACGDLCCADGELCIAESCVTPGIDCEHNQECPDGEVCEATLGQCIPDPGVDCTYRPQFDEFDPEVELAWRADENATPEPTYDQVMMTPAVVDITEDGVPDIVFSTFTGSAYNEESVLRAIDGRTFAPIFDLTDAAKRVSGSASLAIGDIDNDLRNEIVAVAPGGDGLIAFDDHTTGWDVMWVAPGFPLNWDGAYLTDLDGDGRVEVVAGRRVIDGVTGDVLCTNPDLEDVAFNSSAADLNGDGRLEVVAGSGAFHFVDNGDGTFSCPTYWTTATGGFPAVADFGTFENGAMLFGQPDGIPEVVTVSTAQTDQIQLLNGQTGESIWTATLPTTDHPHFTDEQCSQTTGAGPPTIADFDGDQQPEVAMAGACYYVVYETDGSLLWKHPSQDFSSRVTGSSVFDFQGDGKAEAVYADECFVRVYDGAGNGDGTTDVLFKRSHTSGTTRELPVVVDVDRDFHAEIIMISNDYSSVTELCTDNWPDFEALGGAERGILVVKDPNDEWVTTRPVWNQHAYHVTNVCDGIDDSLCPGAQNLPGVIPAQQQANWELGFLNNFRQNVQGEGLFDAPDLVISDIDRECGDGTLTIAVTVANQGARGVLAGVKVAVYFSLAPDEQLVAVLETTADLPPGGRETLTYEWIDAPDLAARDVFTIRAIADADADGVGTYNECVEDNNTGELEATCRCTEDSDCDINEFCSDGTCLDVPD